MNEDNAEHTKKYFEVFFPYAKEKLEKFKQSGGRFAYYTSAATAHSILEKKELWLRNVRLMNDYSEVSHGMNCLFSAWGDPTVKAKIETFFQQIWPNEWSAKIKELEGTFNNKLVEQVYETYILCFSEHGAVGGDEDLYGRLSMWRAYGGDTSIAFILKSDWIEHDSNAFNAVASPVLYANSDQFKDKFIHVLENLERNIEWLKKQDAQQVWDHFLNVLLMAIVSTKHPGFAEEKEWRIIYLPVSTPSKRMVEDFTVKGGIPQTIYKLPLDDFSDQDLPDFTIQNILDKIIIGPTLEPGPILKVFHAHLSKAGVQKPSDRIIISKIPLRR